MTQDAHQTGQSNGADAAVEQEPRIDTPEAAQTLCGQITVTIGELVSTLDRETAQLRKGRALDMTALHARKSALTTTLMRQMAVFGRDSQYISMATPERVAEIKSHQEVFQKALISNQDALNAMKAVSESLLRTIATRVGETKGGPEVYGGNAQAEPTKTPAPPAISIDQSF
jgi:flagellar biosynthesis/type III secretory pathway chaperone